MVIIHQETTESGSKFVSTVLETPQEGSYTSGFSLNSQLSISERSAVYKQRIDSLFGRPGKKPRTFVGTSKAQTHSEPFCIRIDGKSVSPTAGLIRSTAISSSKQINTVSSYSTSVVTSSTATSTSATTSKTTVVEGTIVSTSEDDEYLKINDNCSIVTDSLNHQVKISSKSSRSKSKNNISSVTITCEDSESSVSHLHSLMHTASSSGEEGMIMGQSETCTDKIMWRNNAYGESSSSAGNSSSRPDKSFSTVRCSPGGILKFAVEYLGSIPVTGNTATLHDLQAPLKSLYVNYLSNDNMMNGQLAITSDGLRFEAPKIRLVNPFTTIAVWAAVKFVGRGNPFPKECAFMPLISDPEGQDKSRLFSVMDSELCGIYQACISDPGRGFKNPPIFACVMREATFSLDCHAFVCKCAEDAIVIAANLYQSLVDKMRTGKEGESGYGSLTRVSPTTQSSMNQNRSSSCSSTATDPAAAKFTCSIKPILTHTTSSSSTQNENRGVFSDSESMVPVRPPRKKKKPTDIPCGNLKRYNSDDSVLLNMPSRRRSFRNGYQGHYIKNKKRVQIHTPDDDLSSADSFADSVDQVLDRIVDPCGMSFKDLKPAHQELILKIALTLTQDQLYKKSKQAMKKHEKAKKKQKSLSSSAEGSDDNSQFMNHFLKSISKISLSGKSIPISKRPLNTKANFGASVMSARQKQKALAKPQIAVPSKAILKKPKEDECSMPFMSFCSGCACDKCSDKCYCSLLTCKQTLNNGRCVDPTPTPTSSSSTANASSPSQHPTCSSTDIPVSRKSCGYDTDSCAESEKCYCSLQRVKSNGLKIYNINLDTETSDTDTNSYDLQTFNNSKLHDSSGVGFFNRCESSQRAVEILSYHPSRRLSYCFSPTSSNKAFAGPPPITYATSNREKFSQGKHTNKYKDTISKENAKHSKNKVLLITGSNSTGQVIYKDAPFKLKPGLDFGNSGITRRKDSSGFAFEKLHESSSSPENKNRQKAETPCSSSSEKNKAEFAPERVLSMKKSAEIAAMFNDLKLNSPADFILSSPNTDADETGQQQHDTSIDFQTSLGYLP